jgi:hypothetical protein
MEYRMEENGMRGRVKSGSDSLDGEPAYFY